MKPKKDRIIKDVKAEYVKRMKSPIYMKNVKRNVEEISNYNFLYNESKLKPHEIRSIARYFAEDIKNPIMKPNQIVEEKPDVLTDSLRIT